MSSQKKFNQFLKYQQGVRTPRPLKKNTTDSSNVKNNQQKRILQRSDQLFFFESTLDEVSSSKASPPLIKQSKTESQSTVVIDLTSPPCGDSESNARPQLGLSIKENTFIQTKSKFFDENKENSFEPKTSPNIVVKKDVTKRKIIKAKRHILTAQITQESITHLENSLKHQNVNVEKKSPDASKIVGVKPVASPFLPSANSSVDDLENHLRFESSKEEVHPSTQGSVDSSKRRTFELEDSITDISALKLLSKQDSKRFSSLNSAENSLVSSVKGGKVTQRRRWDKSNHFSPIQIKIPSPVKRANETPTFNAKKTLSRVKIPNFAAIHKKALDKVENISDYKKRTAERARRLLSGFKPKLDNSNKSAKESRKHLRFSSDKEERARKLLSDLKQNSSVGSKHLRFAPDTSQKEKSPTFIPLPCTPLPRYRMMADSPIPVKASPFKFTNFKPVFDFAKKVEVRPNNAKTNIPVFDFKKDSASKSNDLKAEKNDFSKGFNYHFGFGGRAPISKTLQNNVAQQIKSVATKSKPTAITVDTRRIAIKGVRSNRRFDLLMDMRKGK